MSEPYGEPTPTHDYSTTAYPVAGPTPPAMAPMAPMTQPVSAAYPVSAPAYPFSALPLGFEQPKPKRTGMILLTVATIVLAVVAAGMTTLFFVEHTQRATADKKVSEQTTALTAEQAKSKDLQTQLDTSKSAVTQLNQDLEGEKNKTDDITK